MRPYRAWINQPSKLQSLHSEHGKVCIAINQTFGKSADVYFTEGAVLSMVVPRSCLSEVQEQVEDARLKDALQLIKKFDAFLHDTGNFSDSERHDLVQEIDDFLCEELKPV